MVNGTRGRCRVGLIDRISRMGEEEGGNQGFAGSGLI